MEASPASFHIVGSLVLSRPSRGHYICLNCQVVTPLVGSELRGLLESSQFVPSTGTCGAFHLLHSVGTCDASCIGCGRLPDFLRVLINLVAKCISFASSCMVQIFIILVPRGLYDLLVAHGGRQLWQKTRTKEIFRVHGILVGFLLTCPSSTGACLSLN